MIKWDFIKNLKMINSAIRAIMGRRKTNGATGKRLYEHLQRLDLQRYQTLQLWMET